MIEQSGAFGNLLRGVRRRSEVPARPVDSPPISVISPQTHFTCSRRY